LIGLKKFEVIFLAEFVENTIEIYLDKHSVAELHVLIDKVVERKAEKETPEYAKKVEQRMTQLMQGKLTSNAKAKLTQATDEQIVQLEQKCPAIQRMLQKNNLVHIERTALLFIYIPLGKKGEERLKQIMQAQQNYKPNTTNTQIENYKKKGKFYGITCNKLYEWGICNGEKEACEANR